VTSAGAATSFLLAALVVFAAGCGEDDRPADFDYIHAAIIVPNCTTSACHTKANKTANVELWDRDVACEEHLAETNDNPEDTRLVQLLRGEYDDVLRMPPDRKLPDPDIELIVRWFEDGASCD